MTHRDAWGTEPREIPEGQFLMGIVVGIVILVLVGAEQAVMGSAVLLQGAIK